MKSLNHLFILLFFITMLSCSKGFDRDIENPEVVEIESTSLTIRSLSEIDDPLLHDQLPKFKSHVKKIISKEFSDLLGKDNQYDLLLDLDNVLVGKDSGEIKFYTFALISLKQSEKGEFNSDAYLTLSFNDKENLINYFQLGFNDLLCFDVEGMMVDKNGGVLKSGYYTPKPSNKPSKAPKSVLCNYDWNGNAPSVLFTYCGWPYGGTVPAPIHVLASVFPEWYVYSNGQWVELDFPRQIVPLTNDFNDLYYLYSDHNTYPINNLSHHPDFPNLIYEITAYYDKVYISQLGYSISNPHEMTYEEDHVHKQAFLDSFFKWLYELETQSPDNYSYLANNPDVLHDLFAFFADYNLNNPINEPLYLAQPWYVVQYANNPDVECINTGADYLITPDGLILMQQLGSGAITIDQFRNALPDCS